MLDNLPELPSPIKAFDWLAAYARTLSATTAVAVGLGLLYLNRMRTSAITPEAREKIFAALQSSSKSCDNSIDSTSATLTLSDGRELGYAQYGSLTGRPIFGLHGLPGSRVDFAFWHESAKKMNARIICVERPGVGLSSPHLGRTLLDHANDIKQLAEHLELESYGVVGMSGGGPYALACAIALPPNKLKAMSIICGLGPPDIGYYGMAWPNYLGWSFGHRFLPGLVSFWASRQPFAHLDRSDEERSELMLADILKSSPHPKDVAVFAEHPELLRQFMRSCREAFVHGFDSFPEDGGLMSKDFGFRVEDIRKDLPVQLWYGRLDTNVPARHGEQIALRLGSHARLRVEDETHSSLEVNWKDQQLKDLLESMG